MRRVIETKSKAEATLAILGELAQVSLTFVDDAANKRIVWWAQADPSKLLVWDGRTHLNQPVLSLANGYGDTWEEAVRALWERCNEEGTKLLLFGEDSEFSLKVWGGLGRGWQTEQVFSDLDFVFAADDPQDEAKIFYDRENERFRIAGLKPMTQDEITEVLGSLELGHQVAVRFKSNAGSVFISKFQTALLANGFHIAKDQMEILDKLSSGGCMWPAAYYVVIFEAVPNGIAEGINLRYPLEAVDYIDFAQVIFRY